MHKNNSNNFDNSKKDFDDDVYYVENIVDHRFQNGRYEYLIKWMYYGPNCNTWEPIECFTNRQFVEKYNQRNHIEMNSNKETSSTENDSGKSDNGNDDAVNNDKILGHRIHAGIFEYKIKGDSVRHKWKKAEYFDETIIDEYNKNAKIGLYSEHEPVRIIAENRNADDEVIVLIERDKIKFPEYVRMDWMIMNYPKVVNQYLDP